MTDVGLQIEIIFCALFFHGTPVAEHCTKQTFYGLAFHHFIHMEHWYHSLVRFSRSTLQYTLLCQLYDFVCREVY